MSADRPNDIQRLLAKIRDDHPSGITVAKLPDEIQKHIEATTTVEEKAMIRALLAESDRGTALICGEMLNNELGAVIRSRFVPPTSKLTKKTVNKLLDGDSAALGTFAKRSAYCFAMGYFNDKMFVDLELIRDTRNLFAHSLDMKSFGDREIAEHVAKLSQGDEAADLFRKSRGGDQISYERAKFLGASLHYNWLLRVLSGKVQL